MKWTDYFIERPVLASVLALLVFFLGFRSIFEIGLRQYPKTKTTVVNVTTAYPGASAQLMQGFVTTPLERAIAATQGIAYLTSSSSQGSSSINAHMHLNYSADKALTEITAAVNQVRNVLPVASQSPVIQVSTGERTSLMYLSFYSHEMTQPAIADYLTRVVDPQLESVNGVASASILGSPFAMRIWLNPDRLMAYHLTPAQVVAAIASNNFIAAVGRTKSRDIAINVNAATGLHSVRQFKRLVVFQSGHALVRLGQLGRVELGAENDNGQFIFDGREAVAIAINTAPNANPLSVATAIRKLLPSIRAELPPSMHVAMAFDASQFIRSAIHDVIMTILETALIVIAVIFLFLGSMRAVLIPVVTIPLSLIGVVFLMWVLGYTLNLLTLLALVLAIGLVVDDAIVVVENIHRHIEEGHSPLQAALIGGREIGAPVIGMTLTLAAVYAPIGFLTGITGSLFREFAFTLAGAVLISGFLALTLSPMMCSKLLRRSDAESPLARTLDRLFDRVHTLYGRVLHGALEVRWVAGVVGLIVLASIWMLYQGAHHELAPTEDQGIVFVQASGSQTATLGYLEAYIKALKGIFNKIPGVEHYFMGAGFGGGNSLFAGVTLAPRSRRSLSAQMIQPKIQQAVSDLPGLNGFALLPPALPGTGGGTPVELEITTTQSYPALYRAADRLKEAAIKSGLFAYADTSLKFDDPQYEIRVNRALAAEMGITMSEVGSALANLMSGGYIDHFSLEGESYRVIPQVVQKDRFHISQLAHYEVAAGNGTLVPLGNFVKLTPQVEPNALDRFDQMNSTELDGVPMPGVSLGQALGFLKTAAHRILPKGYGLHYAGLSRQYEKQGSALMVTFFFALVVIFLVLAGLFESFRDPLIVLVSVPMSISGALLFLNLGFASVNIYTQIGLITLIGLISKHGILMTQFANELQRTEGLSRREAIERAATTRLRPILMTTAAMVIGVLPLIFAAGAGAASRYDIGLVLATGLVIGTAFTLFMVPTVYTWLAHDLSRETARSVAVPEPASS